jgi:2-(1,2-epoxy-1,2-dihydrophenyl)acetyl-CoA isomerase
MNRAKTVRWVSDEGVGLITMNRPEKLNALNWDLFEDMKETLRAAEEDNEVRALILTGEGKGFCAGGDLEDHPAFVEKDPLAREKLIRKSQLLALALYGMSKPLIAAVNGVCAGAGVDIAAACDIRIASENAVFAMSFIRAGAMPDLGSTFLLPRLIGLGRAFELMLTGDSIDAGEASRIGLVNRVVSPPELIPEARRLALRLARGSADAHRLIKSAVHRGLSQDLEQALDDEARGQNLLFDSEPVKAYVRKYRK